MNLFLKIINSLVVIVLATTLSIGQNTVYISGKLNDTSTFKFLEHSSVMAIDAKDSQLVDFTRADGEGNYQLKVAPNNNYILIANHPDFANSIFSTKVEDTDVNLGNTYLYSKKFLLQDVIVKGQRAIMIKGDTTEYAADSFKVREFANVDELLKKLPGLEVDAQGNITAHGEKVEKMLVDGDEFFGDDPAVLSKMLRASAIDKVQVFDKKSEEAIFTGVDDGERTKTINLKLKDNAKAGYFGKAEVGGGLPSFWHNELMFNSFKGKRKLSVFGIMGNTNNTGLGWEDEQKYGGGSGFRRHFGGDDNESGMFSYRVTSSSDEDGFGSSFTGQGLPKTWNGGLHYDNKFGKNKQHDINFDYRYNKNQLNADIATKNQYIIADSQYVNNDNTNKFSSRVKHNIKTNGELVISPKTNIYFRAGAGINEGIYNYNQNTSYQNNNSDTLNKTNTKRNSNFNGNDANASLYFRHKFAKDRRTFTARVNLQNKNTQSVSEFNSLNKVLSTGITKAYNQNKKDSSTSLSVGTRLRYTEPLSEKFTLTGEYSVNLDNSEDTKLSFDKTGTNTDTLNNRYSSSYGFRVLTNSVGTRINYRTENLSYGIGGSVAKSDFRKTDFFSDSTVSYSNYNFFPRAFIRFGKRRSSNLSINYNGRTNQPTIGQLQPINNNTDPTNIMIGNPNLKQEFTHSINANFGKFNILEERYTYGNAGFTYTQNSISLAQNITPNGFRTYQYVNMDGNMNAFAWAGHSLTLRKIDTRLSLNLGSNFSRNNSIVNQIKTRSNNLSINTSISLNHNRDTTMSIDYTISPSYNYNSSNQGRQASQSFYQLQQNLNFNYEFKHGIEFNTELDWLLRQKVDKNDINNNVLIVNASLSKFFMKDRSLVLALKGYDLLNQNIGFNRYVNNTNITETKYNNIKRYFMLSLSWNFTKSLAINDSEKKIKEANVEAADTEPDSYQ